MNLPSFKFEEICLKFDANFAKICLYLCMTFLRTSLRSLHARPFGLLEARSQAMQPTRMSPSSTTALPAKEPLPTNEEKKNSSTFSVIYRYDPGAKQDGSQEPSADALGRMDESSDSSFYLAPRFVTHIDDNAIARLKNYYGSVLPTSSDKEDIAAPPRILDLCSSWISHYPVPVTKAASERKIQIYGLGMSDAELDRNSILDSGGRIVRDLNEKPNLVEAIAQILKTPSSHTQSSHQQTSDGDRTDSQPKRSPKSLDADSLSEDQKLSATTCTVSIDYLTQPVKVLSSLRSITRKGGSVHLAVSNRCFPTKAVNRWLKASEDQRLKMCCEDLWTAGWEEVQVVQVTDGTKGANKCSDNSFGGLTGLMGMLGLSGDPLWVVRGTNLGS